MKNTIVNNQLKKVGQNGAGKIRVLWAVDPFSKDRLLQRSTAATIKNLTRGLTAEVEPIYLLNTSLFDLKAGVPRILMKQAREDAQKNINEIVDGIEIPGLKMVRVIPGRHLYLREDIHWISQEAKRLKADWVVTTNHLQKTAGRWATGSFSETLLLYSDVPLLFVNPSLRSVFRFKRILFPTDFSPDSRLVYERILEMAQSIGGEIILFNKLAYAWPPAMGYPSRSYELLVEAVDEQQSQKRAVVEAWKNIGKQSGVKVGFLLDRKKHRNLSNAVLDCVKKGHYDIVAMATRSGPIKTMLIGSNSRAVVRSSPVPVFIFHPKKGDSVRREWPVIDEEDLQIDLRSFNVGKKKAA